MNISLVVITLLLAGCLLAGTLPAEAVTKTFTIREPFSLAWGPDRVNYPVEFPRGEVVPEGVALRDAAGTPVSVQLSDIIFWPDKKTVKSATLSFIATLQPDQVGQWQLTAGKQRVRQQKADLVVTEHNGVIELTTSRTGIRLAGGVKTFVTPALAEQLPAPIQGIRLRDDRWIGKGWWQTDTPCVGYSVKLLERGPVYARVALRYDFAGNTLYQGVVELSAGQELAVIREEFNLSDGKRYPMPEQPGTKPGDTFAYVKPHFDPPERGMLWDWWGGTHGRVPSPNCYNFSFYAGLQPNRCEWSGRMWHVYPNVQGINDNVLPYDKDGRLISVNAFLNWGDDEALYFGAYNAQGDEEVAVVGLRPGQWINPDIDPHPINTINQWTQTNNLWIERRTAPDLFLRAPTCLGQRMYAIGTLQRHEVKDVDGKAGITSEIMLRHIRFGRQRLDEVKDWVLDYPETSKYPRLLVDAGDLARLRARAKAHLKDDNLDVYVTYLLKGDAETGKRLVSTTIEALQTMCRRMATSDYDHNGYAMNLPRLAFAADVALAAPECTPEQAAVIRRLVAATAYNTLSPDYVPSREAGYGWGSANMMEALRSRGASLMVSLLPNHPSGKAWRQFLVKFLTANALAKINEAGCTLEIGAYGVMGIEFASVPFMALSRCDPTLSVDPVITRLRAAARARLSYLLPYDVRGGFRAPAPIGDSPYQREGAFPYLAGIFADRDPQLTRQLLWGIREGGAELNGYGVQPGLLYDANAEVSVPDLRTEHFPGSGIIMRSGFPQKDETYINLNSGGFAIGHGHSDRGAFILYAKGAPLMVDFGSQYVPGIGEAWLHNGGITFNHDEMVRPCPGRDKDGCFFTGKVWSEHTVEPFTCLEPGWDPQAKNLDDALGRVEAFATLPATDYGVLTRRIGYLNRVPYMLEDTHKQFMARGPAEEIWLKQPFTWTRRALFVKSPDPLGPNYLVLRDDLRGNTELKPALNFWCLADKLDLNGNTSTYTGQFRVDLDLYVAEPAQFTALTHRAGHTNGRDFAPNYQKSFGKAFEEYQRLCQLPQQPGGGYYSVLVPRKHAEAAPTFATVLNGNGIRVTFPDRTDTLVLLNQPGDVTLDDLTLHGTAFVLTTTAGHRTITMLAPGTVKQGEKVLLAGAEAKTVEIK